jgi:hypothetical protein
MNKNTGVVLLEDTSELEQLLLLAPESIMDLVMQLATSPNRITYLMRMKRSSMRQ